MFLRFCALWPGKDVVYNCRCWAQTVMEGGYSYIDRLIDGGDVRFVLECCSGLLNVYSTTLYNKMSVILLSRRQTLCLLRNRSTS
jgi:hypothetical protein